MAMERIINVAAWDPQLPPELMIRGRKKMSSLNFSSGVSYCIIARAVRSCPPNRIASHPTRLRTIENRLAER